MTTPLECLRVETADNPEYCVIWLHGLGADGYDFLPMVKELEALGVPPARYLFPHAPQIPVSINNGMTMRAWYDIKNVDLQRQEDAEGIKQSSVQIHQLIQTQISKGFDSRHIVLAGFSQGGAITYHAGLRFPCPLGGLIALSCYLTLPESLTEEASQENAKVPIYAAHGTNDQIVPLNRGELAAKTLESQGYAVQWSSFQMEHSVCNQEIREIGAFLKAVFI